jgi:hypothetical protein
MFLPADKPSDATTRICRGSRDTHGFVMNLTHLWSWRPDLFEAFTALRNLGVTPDWQLCRSLWPPSGCRMDRIGV